MKYKLPFPFLLICLVLFSCKKSGDSNIDFKVQLRLHNMKMKVGDRELLKVQSSATTAILGTLKWISSGPDIVEVTEQGEVIARAVGEAVITVKYKLSYDSCKIQVIGDDMSMTKPIDFTPLNQPFSNDLIYSKIVPLVAPFRVMQCFDIDSKGNIYYTQIGAASGFVQGKTKAHELYIIRGRPNANPLDYMTLKYFGHGGQVAVEEDGDNVYIWINSNATKYSSGEYWDARSVSRIKYEPGKVYVGSGGETYFLNNGIYRIEAAIDKASDLICINATKDGVRYFFTYKLSEVLALPVTSLTFSVTVGGEETGESEHVDSRTEQGHDLSILTPLGSFQVPVGVNKVTDPNSYSFQGYDIDASKHIYFFEGNAGDINAGSSSIAYATTYDLQGNIIGMRTRVSAISDASTLESVGITNSSGHMEAEGIKVKGNKIYLGFGSYEENGSHNYRRANIFMYNSERR